MGLLDSVLGAISGGGQQGGPGGGEAAMLSAVVGMLGQGGAGGGAAGGLGGLMGLVEKLQQSGLGPQVASWIGTGQNQPVTGDQVTSALGSGAVGQIAEQLGLSHGDAAGQLAQVLPGLIDKLSPNGQLPQGGGAGGELASLLGGLLKS
ncbi:MAG: DUF937 domain-containing protein [Burkholderiales bacterium]|nr:DUF937 domain-containing protein [Burkholderiales bacterium]MDE1927001.1 DUF937 domain-containing protein [Burkholderiales bacterium]MDE2159497.1 DUF937 domain-containing protein [Burkholderiales bacterium]